MELYHLRPLLNGLWEVWRDCDGATMAVFSTSAKALAWISKHGREA